MGLKMNKNYQNNVSGAARQLVGSETKTVVQKNNQDKLPQDNIKSKKSRIN